MIGIGRYRYHLVLYASPLLGDAEPYFKVAAHVREFGPEIRPYVLTYDRHPIRRASRYLLKRFVLPRRPTLFFSPAPTDMRLARGAQYIGQRLVKSAQYAALARRSIPIPPWALVTEGQQPDLRAFGPYVVVKPDRGGLGAEVKIMRRGRVRWRQVATQAGVSEALIVQAFIYTGPWPVSYRVSTLFGQALYCIQNEASHTRTPLSGPQAFGRLLDDKGVSIVSTSKGCTMALCYDEEVIRFAERAHDAFPEIPLLGLDIVREQPGGELHVLEVNPGGAGWHFAYPRGLRAQREFGFSFERQFDGLRKAARILAERTRKEAC